MRLSKKSWGDVMLNRVQFDFLEYTVTENESEDFSDEPTKDEAREFYLRNLIAFMLVAEDDDIKRSCAKAFLTFPQKNLDIALSTELLTREDLERWSK